VKKILCLLVLFVVSSYSMDTEDLVKNVRVLTEDQIIYGVSPRYSTATIVSLLNVYQDETVDLTWCLNYRATKTLVAGTTYYALPDTSVVPYRVVFATTNLEIISYKQLDDEYPGWQNTAKGRPERYYIAVSTYMNSPVTIGIYPLNNASATLTVDYILQPTDLIYPDSIPFNGETKLYTYHSLLSLRVASVINGIRGESTLASDQKADYSALLAAMLKTIRVKPGEIPADDQREK